MDEETKKQIKRLWCNRLFVSVFSIGLFGCSLGMFSSALKHRPQQPLWVLKMSQSVEDLTNEESSIEQRELALDQIFRICEQWNLLDCVEFSKYLSQSIGSPVEVLMIVNRTFSVQESIRQTLLVNHYQSIYRRRHNIHQHRFKIISQNVNNEEKRKLEQELERVMVLELDLMGVREFVPLQEKKLVQLLELVQELVRKRRQRLVRLLENYQELEPLLEQEQEMVRLLERGLVLIQYTLLEFIITKELDLYHNLKLIQGSDLENYLNNEPKRQHMFLVSVTLLSLSVLLLLISLFTLTKLQSSYNLPPNSHLIAFLPEECVAEMGALARRMKKANASPWEIRMRLLEEFVTLIWVFYIQIKLENLSLPFQDKQIDE